MYQQTQLTPQSRYLNNITTHKVLQAESTDDGCNLIIGCTDKISGGKLKLHLYGVTVEAGQWLDFVFKYANTSGTIGAYGYQYIGRTPDRFISTDTNKTWSK